MTLAHVETRQLNALQRLVEAPDLAVAPRTGVPLDQRSMLRITAIGRPWKGADPVTELTSDHRTLPTAGVLAGAAGRKIPVAFSITGGESEIAIELGTWDSRGGEAAAERLSSLSSMLRGPYASVHSEASDTQASAAEWRDGDETSGWWVRGIPTPPMPDRSTGALAMDRLIRSLSGKTWKSLVLATPIPDAELMRIRNAVVNEMRRHDASPTGGQGSPLTRHYLELLGLLLENMTAGLSVGAWRTAAYLLEPGDEDGPLTSAWLSTFAGHSPVPEPIRILPSPAAAALAGAWAISEPADGPDGGASAFRHPFPAQSVLTSTQLAAYIHLPQLEVPGYAVLVEPELAFDVQPPRVTDDALEVGRVARSAGLEGPSYLTPLASLTRHAFVAGVTGSGKTNTLFHLLRQATERGVPFLVLEPAKTEYRTLLEAPGIGSQIRVFTLGNEAVAPFRLNPLEAEAGTPLAVHIDLLRSVFVASFGMWTPLPQILERCLYEVYEDRGWDVTNGVNRRLANGERVAEAYPTLADLAAKVDIVTTQLGYDERVTSDMRAALLTRINALRIGARGRMLDGYRSIPMAELLRWPTVLELEHIGDDDDKAFLMGLLLIRLVEHRRAGQAHGGLRHLLVIEEAHRLLAAVPRRASEEQADPRGKAVDAFTNVLAEIRAYGQGVIVADQVPVRLAPEVIKNTGLKIVHRVVAGDDREVLAAAMAMDDRQSRALTTLATGVAAVYGGSDDAPVLVRVPFAKMADGDSDNEEVARRAQAAKSELVGVYTRSEGCRRICAGDDTSCERARRLLDRPDVQVAISRAVLSGTVDAGALGRLWPDVVALVRAQRHPSDDEAAVVRSLAGHGAEWLAERRGAASGWTYQEVAFLAADLQGALLEVIEGERSTNASETFQRRMRTLLRRTYDPFPRCAAICPDGTNLFRWAAADMVASTRFEQPWADAMSTEDWVKSAWPVAQDAGAELVEWFDPQSPDPDQIDAARRASLCFAQQMLMGGTRRQADVRGDIDQLLERA
jgi:Helicase HerA, central domain